MKKITRISTVPACLLIVFLIAFPAFDALGDEPEISGGSSITLGTLTAADFSFSDGSWQFPSSYKAGDTLTLSFTGEADLDVKLVGIDQPADSEEIDLSHLKIGLVEDSGTVENWKDLSSFDSWIDLETYESDDSEDINEDYKLKYELAKAGVPAPYDYTINLKFRLTQQTNELVIIKKSYTPGKDEVRLRVEDAAGSNVKGATVKVFNPENYPPDDPHDSGQTGSSGDVRLNVPPGTSTIIATASKDGYNEEKREFSL